MINGKNELLDPRDYLRRVLLHNFEMNVGGKSEGCYILRLFGIVNEYRLPMAINKSVIEKLFGEIEVGDEVDAFALRKYLRNHPDELDIPVDEKLNISDIHKKQAVEKPLSELMFHRNFKKGTYRLRERTAAYDLFYQTDGREKYIARVPSGFFNKTGKEIATGSELLDYMHKNRKPLKSGEAISSL